MGARQHAGEMGPGVGGEWGACWLEEGSAEDVRGGVV